VTHYLVFKRVPQEDAALSIWEQFTSVEASSARAAIRLALAGEKNPMGDGEYVATPLRSWQPVKVTVEQKREVAFS
jgi:hypothetical protein